MRNFGISLLLSDGVRMSMARATYITPFPAANYGECDWISISTHRLVSVLIKEGGVRFASWW